MKLTILQKPGRFTAKNFNSNLEEALGKLKGELSASIKLEGFSPSGWALVDIAGEDFEIVSELVSRQLGQARTDLGRVELHGVYDGIVAKTLRDGVEVDIGISEVEPSNVRITAATLRAQLTDGKSVPAEEIARFYCLLPGNRASVRITDMDPSRDMVEGWLSDSELESLKSWVLTGLDRIQVNDCFRQEVESAVRKARIERDIVAVEAVTLTTQSVVCKLGTDAIGLIPKLGGVLKGRRLSPFVPRRILAQCRPW